MYHNLIKGLLAGMVVREVAHYRRVSTHLLKMEAAKFYLQGVRMARMSAIGVMRMGLVIGLVCVGVVLFHAGLFILLPWPVKVKALVGLFLGCGYVVIGCLALHASMDEKIWMEKSGVAGMLEEATRHSNTI